MINMPIIENEKYQLHSLDEKHEVRGKILAIEKSLSTLPGVKFGDIEDCPLKHSFADGVYVREIFIPKGMLIVGKIHRHAHPNFLLKGKVSVITESGGVERLEAPLSMISPAGTKRIVYTHEDTTWVTVHLNETNTTNLDELEKEVIAKTFEELEGIKTIEIKSDEENIAKMIELIKVEEI